MTFRYSGSKKRLMKYLPSPPKGTKTIIEPFAGSLAYSMEHKPEHIIAAESNELIRDLWLWFATSCEDQDLIDMLHDRPHSNIDLREVYKRDALTLMRLQTSGVYTGQLSSYIHYAQHSTGLMKLVPFIDYSKKSLKTPLYKSFEETFPDTQDADTIVFLDPPYNKTSANYKGVKDHGKVDYHAVEEYFLECNCPAFMTYGDGAQDTFSRLHWEKLVERKVPNIRNGGTTNRTEWITYKDMVMK